ncbi:zinc finger protein 865 isoform X2 [Hyalella azteca]|uniref:Zinc finger protein 865 isoform X2 n=1 Tax=Hyalella azteca TaxID=294128 RepID=A0A8B7NE21_HYAAZ|nr:zinc finger protein 865 isoform X2 [Hyalella azteca]
MCRQEGEATYAVLMMGSDQYCLKWNYHWANLVGVFNSLLETETFVDVTISCEGRRVKAHRLVLSACSPYFTQLLVDNPDRHPVIILKGIKYDHLKAIIHFIYNGEVAVDQKELPVLISIARELQIRGLADKRLQETQLQLAAARSFSKIQENESSISNSVENIIPIPSTEVESTALATKSNGNSSQDPGESPASFSCTPTISNSRSVSVPENEHKSDDEEEASRTASSDMASAKTEPLSMTAMDQPTDLTSNGKQRCNASSSAPPNMPPPSPCAAFVGASAASLSPRSSLQVDSCSPTPKRRRLSDGEGHQNGTNSPSKSQMREDELSGNDEPDVRSRTPDTHDRSEEPLELTVTVNRDSHEQRRQSPVNASVRTREVNRSPSAKMRLSDGLLKEDGGDCVSCAPSSCSPPVRPPSGLSVTPLPHASPLHPSTPAPMSRHQLTFIQRALAMGYPPLPYFGAGLDAPASLPPGVPGLSNQTKDLLQFLDLVKSLGNSDSALPAGIAPSFTMPGMVGAAPVGVVSPAKDGEAEYTCHICARIMPSQQFLEEHIKIHEEEKPYKCDHCGQRYKYQSAFQRHQEQNHTAKLPGEKPYRCTVCGQCFKYHKSFLKHRSNHDVLDHIMKNESSDESKSSLPPAYIQCLLNSRLGGPPLSSNVQARGGLALDSRVPLSFKEELVDVDDSIGDQPPSTPSASIPENGEVKDEDEEMEDESCTWKFIHCLKCKATFRDVANFDAHCRLLSSECSHENMREVSVPGGENSNLSNPHSGSSSPPASPHRSPGWPPSLNSRSPLAGAAASSPQLHASMLSPSCATTASSSSSLYSPFTSINFTSLSNANKVTMSPTVMAMSSAASSLPIIVSASASVCPASVCATTLGGSVSGVLSGAGASASSNSSGAKLLEDSIPPSSGGGLSFEEERPFKCPYCTKGFKGRENLKLHIRTHTGEKPYNCGVCGKAFGGRSDMNRHLRIHTGEKPYPCKVCGKKFARADYLSKHITTHLGIPFAKPVHSLQQSLQNLETVRNYQSMQNLSEANNVQTN